MLTKEERNLRKLLQLWAVLLTGCTLVFLFGGNFLLSTINEISARFNLPFVQLPLPVENFWMTLTLSLMTLLIFLSIAGAKDIRGNRITVPAILVSKFASSFFFFFFFMKSSRSLAYLVGLFTDGSMFLVTYYFYSKLRK